MTYQLRNGFGEEVVVTTIGGGMRGAALEVEVGEHFPIRQGSQQQLLREIFAGGRLGLRNWGEIEEGE